MKPKLARFAQAPAPVLSTLPAKFGYGRKQPQVRQSPFPDISKFGYVNLAPQARQAKDYDKTSFQNRQGHLGSRLYQHI